jgi:hypothetical protein
MPVPTTILDISAQESANYPKGDEDPGSNVDNYFRAAFAILKQQHSMGLDIDVSQTLYLAPEASVFKLAGTGTISEIENSYVGRLVWLIFKEDDAVIENSTSIIVQGGANITAKAGDSFLLLNESNGVWRVLLYSRASGQPASENFHNVTVAGTLKALNTTSEFKSVTVNENFNSNIANISTLTTSSPVNCPQLSISQGASLDPHAVPYGQLKTLFRSLRPVGTFFWWTNPSPPIGALTCHGGAVSRTTYSDLFAVIGDRYGGGDGSTTFNLPNFQSDQTPVVARANAVGSTTLGAVISHAHPGSYAEPGGSHSFETTGGGAHSHTVSGNVVIPPFAGELFSNNLGNQLLFGGSNPVPIPNGIACPNRTGTFSGWASDVGNHTHWSSIPNHNHGVNVLAFGSSANLPAGIRLLPCIWALPLI